MMRIFTFLILLVSDYSYATSLFQDPRRADVDELLNTYSPKDINCVPGCVDDNNKKSYIKAVLSLSDGYNELGVDKDCTFAFNTLSDLWDHGINDAGYELSRMYYHGVCVDIDLEKSKQLLAASANSNYVPAQKLLGKSYWRKEIQSKLYGKNTEKAAFWLMKSAQAGDAESAAIISVYYREGIVYAKDPQKSFLWAQRAFSSKYGGGIGGNSIRLASYYEKGYGVDKNYIKSYKYYDLSGTAGNDDKQRVSEYMSDAEIQQAIKQSRAWQEEHNTFVPSYYGLEHQSDGSYR